MCQWVRVMKLGVRVGTGHILKTGPGVRRREWREGGEISIQKQQIWITKLQQQQQQQQKMWGGGCLQRSNWGQ
jgi:hypothetical protein